MNDEISQKLAQDYYEKVGERIIPFLEGREAAITQVFENNTIFRDKDNTNKPLRISNKKALLKWVSWHGRDFFSSIDSPKAVWFCMDIDKRKKIPFELVKVAAEFMCIILKKAGIDFLLKFSGENGFHFIWNLGKIDRRKLKKIDSAFVPEKPRERQMKNVDLKVWDFERRVIENLRERLEKALQHSNKRDDFYTILPHSNPITVCDRKNIRHKNSILIDSLLMHERGFVRTPYSLHLKTGYVSVPIFKKELPNFNPEFDARMEAVINDTQIFQVPEVEIEKLIELLLEE